MTTMLDRPRQALVLVELFDARTGRKLDEVEGENYITPTGLAYARWKTRHAYMGSMPGVNNFDVEPVNPFGYIYVSDSAAVEDTGSSHPEGVPLGWATKSAYSGSSIYQGSPNLAECEADTTRAKWVFDWATTAANGDIRSVGWSPMMQDNGFGGNADVDSNNNDAGFGMMLLPSGQIYRGRTSTNQPYVMNPITLANEGDWGPTATQIGLLTGIAGCCHDGTTMWVSDTTARNYVRSFPLPSGPGAVSASSLAIPGTSWIRGVAYDGTMLWVTDVGTRKAYRCNKTTGAIDREFSLSSTPASNGSYEFGITYNPARNTLLIAELVAGFSVFTEYDLDGVVVGRFRPQYLHPTIGGLGVCLPLGGSRYGFGGYWSLSSGSNRLRLVDMGVATRVRLPSTITKNSLQTMKVTYTFTYT